MVVDADGPLVTKSRIRSKDMDDGTKPNINSDDPVVMCICRMEVVRSDILWCQRCGKYHCYECPMCRFGPG